MTSSRLAIHRALLPAARRWTTITLVGWNIFSSTPARAHLPFDSTGHVTVMEQTMEATVIVGTGLAEQLFNDSGGHSLPTSGVGTGTVLPVELANRFFEVEANGQTLAASQLRVLSDGLEACFIVTFPRPSADRFRLRAQYAKHLPPAATSLLVLTDDNNKLLGSHIVKSGSETADFNLAKPPVAVVETATPAPTTIHISSPTEVAGAPTSVRAQPVWRYATLIIFAGLVALGGWWLVQKSFCREPN